jgi:hypothetical protein
LASLIVAEVLERSGDASLGKDPEIGRHAR